MRINGTSSGYYDVLDQDDNWVATFTTREHADLFIWALNEGE